MFHTNGKYRFLNTYSVERIPSDGIHPRQKSRIIPKFTLGKQQKMQIPGSVAIECIIYCQFNIILNISYIQLLLNPKFAFLPFTQRGLRDN